MISASSPPPVPSLRPAARRAYLGEAAAWRDHSRHHGYGSNRYTQSVLTLLSSHSFPHTLVLTSTLLSSNIVLTLTLFSSNIVLTLLSSHSWQLSHGSNMYTQYVLTLTFCSSHSHSCPPPHSHTVFLTLLSSQSWQLQLQIVCTHTGN